MHRCPCQPYGRFSVDMLWSTRYMAPRLHSPAVKSAPKVCVFLTPARVCALCGCTLLRNAMPCVCVLRAQAVFPLLRRPCSIRGHFHLRHLRCTGQRHLVDRSSCCAYARDLSHHRLNVVQSKDFNAGRFGCVRTTFLPLALAPYPYLILALFVTPVFTLAFVLVRVAIRTVGIVHTWSSFTRDCMYFMYCMYVTRTFS